MGQGIGALAQGAAQGVRSYYDNKKKKEEEQAAVTFLEGIATKNPATAQAIGLAPGQNGEFDPAAIKAAIKGAGGPAQAVKLGLAVQQQQQAEEQQRQQQELLAQQMRAAQQKAATDAAAAQRQQMIGAGANAVAMGGNVPSYYTNEMANEATLAGRERAAKLAKLQQEATPAAPKAPEGFRPTATGSLEVIPGGPADIKQQEKAAETKAKEDEIKARALAAKSDLEQTLATIRSALAIQTPGANVGGPIAGFAPRVSGIFDDKVPTLDSRYKTIKARLTIDKLAELKALSASGASGFGSLSNQEGQLLGSSIAELDVQLPEKTQRENLLEIDRVLSKTLGVEPLKTTTKERNAPKTLKGPSSGSMKIGRFTVVPE